MRADACKMLGQKEAGQPHNKRSTQALSFMQPIADYTWKNEVQQEAEEKRMELDEQKLELEEDRLRQEAELRREEISIVRLEREERNKAKEE